jgi:hypothetical protein
VRAYLAVALVLAIDALICLAWLGVLWFILVAGFFCAAYLVVSLCVVAGEADRHIEEMFDYHVELDDDGREVLVSVPKKGRGTAA